MDFDMPFEALSMLTTLLAFFFAILSITPLTSSGRMMLSAWMLNSPVLEMGSAASSCSKTDVIREVLMWGAFPFKKW